MTRFVFDVMLGRLAKWFRIYGFDVLYNNAYTDEQILKIAAEEKRIIVTRDRKLSGIENNNIYLTEINIDQQIDELFKKLKTRFNIEPDKNNLLSRCPECNGLLTEISKEVAKPLIEVGVYQSQDKFWQCSICKKVYWLGSHWLKIQERLNLHWKN